MAGKPGLDVTPLYVAHWRYDGNLPAAKMTQRYFEVGGFPMTANGKMQRQQLSPDDADALRLAATAVQVSLACPAP